MLKSKKTVFTIIGAILLIGGIACTLILLAPKNQRSLTPQELLSLGNKYLSELDYENAVVAFSKLIEIEPRNPQGYIGLADAYIGLGDIDKAIEILDQGLEATGDDGIRRLLSELLTPAPEPEVTTVVTTTAAPPEPMLEPELQDMRERDYEVIEFGGYTWRVLERQSGRTLVISEDILERRAYRGNSDMRLIELENTTWATSDIRKYLNGEFYNSFSANDRSKIVQVTNKNPNNQWYGTAGGADTNDYIFLLSLEEVVKYFGDSGDFANRKGWYWIETENGWKTELRDGRGSFINDEYNDNRKAYMEDNSDAPWWWLRSPGDYSNYAAYVYVAYVYGDGFVYVGGVNVDADSGGVRPALWLSLE